MIKFSLSRVEVSRSYRKSCEQVWKLLTDTATWPQWGPSVRAVECEERFIREGSVGRIKTTIGFWVPFEITRYEERRYWSWKVAGIPATGHRLEPLDPDRCRLIFEVPVLAAPYAIVCWIALERIARVAVMSRKGTDPSTPY